MCMFCAAVPTVLSLGLAARHEQRKKQVQAATRDLAPLTRWVPIGLPIGQLTAAALAVTVVAAVVYHTHLGS